jgi:hypothetical protein
LERELKPNGSSEALQERPSVKKLLAYDKEINDGVAKTA